jgi:Nucleotidyl transferase of unknown function (DUF2204)
MPYHNCPAANNIQAPVPKADEKPLPVSSSTAPDFPPEQQRLFREVLQVLNQGGIPYVVSGAFALQKHTGIWRDTKDLDVFLPAQHVPQALECLISDGFECSVLDPVWLAKAHRGDFYVDLISGMSNAVIIVEDSWIERGMPTEIVGVPVRVLAPEELIASKLFVTRRERFDGADIAHVIYGTRGHLDWDRLLQLVGSHWEMLLWALVLFRYVYPARSSYVPSHVWNGLLQRFQHELANPNPYAKFRGSLVDENMFAIDVHEWGLDNLVEAFRAQRQPKLAGPARMECPLPRDQRKAS